MSYRVHVVETIDLPRTAVFTLLSDHEGYTRFPGMSSATLLKSGTPERNGLGAVRRFRSGPIVMREEITLYDPPAALHYQILNRPLLFKHLGARITLEEVEGGTRVTWISEFTHPIPPLGRRFQAQFNRGFRALLRSLPQYA